MKVKMDKIYQAQKFEEKIYKHWQNQGFFNPDNFDGEPYSVMMPPPNVTGVLHLGHALENALMDINTRYQRLIGKKVLLLPGTDHAAVATQAKVEKLLIENEGIKNPREELGREELLKRIRQYSEESKATILKQIKTMGTSCDWSRLAYTFDDNRSNAVYEVFKKMYDDGLIYRGYRVVNWSVKGQSTCSDDELVHVEREAKFYIFKYSKDFPFTIATTRPETKLGDTAVAVNPKDERYKKFIGKVFEVDFCGNKLKLKVIASDDVDPEFGTGALGVTPAHSPVDFEMYEKQKAIGDPIDIIAVIDQFGKMTKSAGDDFAGLNVLEAREKVVEKLKEQGLFVKEENITQSVGTSDRFKDVVEAIPMTQWFIDVNKEIIGRNKSLKQLMKDAITCGHNNDSKQKVIINPHNFEKLYLQWIDNLRDWCISRQIWWGHRLPVWYKTAGKPVEITFIRHAKSQANLVGVADGRSQTELAEIGIEEACKMAKEIKADEFDEIFQSPLKRAQQTAEILFENKKIKVDKRLIEIDFGDLSGKEISKVNKHRLAGFPNGETYNDVKKRIISFLADLMDNYPGKKVAIVAHSNIWRIFEHLINDKELNYENLTAPAPRTPIVYKLKELKQVSEKKIQGWKQDEDTLDTWFSSGLWTFSTLGWPNQTADLKTFHPTSWMQMGYEILFFWMARMILMSTYVLDQVPFKNVYIHGMLRDEKNQKFSKSAGNNIDPLEISAKYGTDALRWSLIVGNTPGNDSKFYEEKVEAARNMVNKLWNISRFILLDQNQEQNFEKLEIENLSLAKKWILSKFNKLILKATGHLEKNEFSQAAELIRDFAWADFADWYLEISKVTKNENQVLTKILKELLILWHPYIPFVTEVIWSQLKQEKDLIVSSWPQVDDKLIDEKSEKEFEKIKEVVIKIRNLRAEYKVEPAKKIKALIKVSEKKFIIENFEIIKALARLQSLEFVEKKPDSSVGAVVEEIEIYLPLADLIDFEKERERLTKEIENLKKYIQGLNNRLKNKEFLENAPAQVVEIEKQKQIQAQEKLQKIQGQLQELY